MAEARIFLERNEHQNIFEHFVFLPGYLENLLIIDLLSRDYFIKNNMHEYMLFTDDFRIRIYQEKRKLDDFYAKYNGRMSELLDIFEARFADRVKNTNDLHLCTIRDMEEVISKNRTSFWNINKNKDKHQSDIDYLKVQETDILYKFSNVAFNDLYKETEDNLYIRALNSPVFKRIMNDSYLKDVVARTLAKMNIPFIQNFCDFPLTADFLLYPGENKKTIIQV